MRFILLTLLIGLSVNLFTQVIPEERRVDWTIAGLKDTTTFGFIPINISEYGIVGDGISANDENLDVLLDSLGESGKILLFPEGNFLFNDPIRLPPNTVVRGNGSGSTVFTIDGQGSGHGFYMQGSSTLDSIFFSQSANKGDDFFYVNDSLTIEPGDWIRIAQFDDDLITSSWAKHTVGQITSVLEIVGNKVIISSPLRLDYDLIRNPYFRKIQPLKNVGLECFKIERIDDTDPIQASNIRFNHAVNCWVNGVESNKCNFSHVELFYSSNIQINNSYFHHALGYGSGGRAYGVTMHFSSNECLIENNVFEHLRHSVLFQAGANGNVCSFNYSFDPFWTSFPDNSAGEFVLHGNYPFANLIEQNICQNIVVDNSHGPNGPHNTLFRNRAELYGIFFTATNSPGQNIVGNEITNTEIPYSLLNYNIQGDDQFIYGNNDEGIIDPPDTENLLDISYAYLAQPSFVPLGQWSSIGPPSEIGNSSIPALDAFNSGMVQSDLCAPFIVDDLLELPTTFALDLFPNPCSTEVYLSIEHEEQMIVDRSVYDSMGQKVSVQMDRYNDKLRFNISMLAKGIYMVGGNTATKRLIGRFVKE